MPTLSFNYQAAERSVFFFFSERAFPPIPAAPVMRRILELLIIGSNTSAPLQANDLFPGSIIRPTLLFLPSSANKTDRAKTIRL